MNFPVRLATVIESYVAQKRYGRPFLISENCAGCVESGELMGGVGPQTVWDPEATESVPSYMERVACAAQLFCLAELKERVSLDRTNRTIA